MDELAERVVDAINDVSGEHPGHRAAHAKGTLLRGTFTGAGAGLTTAAHMGRVAVPVTARFSNGGGDPGISAIVNRWPEQDVTIVALCNVEDMATEVRDQVMAEFGNQTSP